jgi:hypothetical protein
VLENFSGGIKPPASGFAKCPAGHDVQRINFEGRKRPEINGLRGFSIDLTGETIEKYAFLCGFKSLKMSRID